MVREKWAMKRNKYDTDKCLERGEGAQDSFTLAAQQAGWVVRRASDLEDIYKHYDYTISRGNESYTVDVKAMKKLNRLDHCVQDRWLWIELHGVGEENDGWLFGQSDLIGFEMQKAFLLVSRTELIELVNEWVDTHALVSRPERAQYRVYTRPNRADVLTLVESSRLLPHAWGEFDK